MIDRSEHPASKSAQPLLACVALIVLTLAAMSPVLGNELVEWDDYATISNNPRLNPPTAGNVLYYWQHSYMLLYVPVTYTVWSMLAALNGTNPPLFHAASVAVHLMSALMLLALLRTLGCGIWASFAGAAAFAVHPVQVETVAWASGLKDLLCACFSIAALLAYVRATTRPGWASQLLTAGLYLLAMLSKPTAIVLPLLAATIDLLILKRTIRTVVAAVAPLLILAIPCAIWTRIAQPANAGNYPVLPVLLRPLVAGDAMAFYVGKLVAPIHLAIHYSRRPDIAWQHSWFLWTWMIPLTLITAAIVFRRRAPWVVAAVLLFVLGLLPVLGLVPFEFQYYSTVADHYLYLPMIGAAVAIAFALGRSPNSALWAIVAVVLSGWTVLSHLQARRWRDTSTLMTHVVQVNDQSWVGLATLGRLDLSRGELQSGLARIHRAVELRPDDPTLHSDLGTALDLIGRSSEAIDEYRQAIRMSPGLAGPWANLGALLAEQGQFDEAIRCFTEALKHDEHNEAARIGLDKALADRAAAATTATTRPTTTRGG